MTFQTLRFSLLITLVSSLGGFAAQAVHLPLPFMLGSLLLSGAIALFLPQRLPQGYRFPNDLRAVFIVVIGVMIGTKVSPELLQHTGTIAWSLVCLALFVLLAHGCSYLIFRHIGKYDPPTAFYAGSPGGLLEALTLGEAAGANVQLLTIQQFLRIIAVISLLPLGLSLWHGAPLGSASGEALASQSVALVPALQAIVVGLVGYAIGTRLKLPAGQLTGPVLAAAIVTIFGWADLDLPQWMINLSQVVIGTSLGLRFIGMTGKEMVRGSVLAVLSVAGMLGIAVILAAFLQQMVGADFEVMLISFAPGGVTEMALVALSLQANPALVTLHHIFRIFMTVIEMSYLGKWVAPKQKTGTS